MLRRPLFSLHLIIDPYPCKETMLLMMKDDERWDVDVVDDDSDDDVYVVNDGSDDDNDDDSDGYDDDNNDDDEYEVRWNDD